MNLTLVNFTLFTDIDPSDAFWLVERLDCCCSCCSCAKWNTHWDDILDYLKSQNFWTGALLLLLLLLLLMGGLMDWGVHAQATHLKLYWLIIFSYAPASQTQSSNLITLGWLGNRKLLGVSQILLGVSQICLGWIEFIFEITPFLAIFWVSLGYLGLEFLWEYDLWSLLGVGP